MNDFKYIPSLDDRIELIRFTKTRTASGSRTETTENVFKSCKAAKQDVGTTEEADGKVFSLISKRFYINYDKNLLQNDPEEMTVKYLGKYYDITACLEHVKKRILVLNTIKRVSG